MSKELPESLAVSSAKDFKKLSGERGKPELLELPSGLVVKVTKPPISRLIKEGKIPAELSLAIMGDTELPDSDVKPQDTQLRAKNMIQGLEFVDYIVVNSIVEPECVLENPTDEQISVGEIDDKDKFFIMNHVQEGVEGLDSFRKES